MEKATHVAATSTPKSTTAALTLEEVLEQNRILKETLDKKDREAAQGELEHRISTLVPDPTKHAELAKGINSRCGADLNTTKAVSDVVQLIIAAGGMSDAGAFRSSGLKRKNDDATHTAGAQPPSTQNFYQQCLAHYATKTVKVVDGRNTVAETSYVA
jgi:hypothetical protein